MDSNMDQIRSELQAVSQQLEATSSAMSRFATSLDTAGFRSYVDYLARPWYRLWTNFLFGIVYGLGFTIGATVLLGFSVWVISHFLIQLPYIGEFFKTLQQFMSEENLKNLHSQNFMDTLTQMFEAFKANVLQNSASSSAGASLQP